MSLEILMSGKAALANEALKWLEGWGSVTAGRGDHGISGTGSGAVLRCDQPSSRDLSKKVQPESSERTLSDFPAMCTRATPGS